MAFLRMDFKSEVLNSGTSVNIILPERRDPDKPLPVMYLLHGYTDDESAWCRQTSVERYARYRNTAIVMPNAYNSFYTDMKNGVYNCYSYITEELVPFCRESFNLSPRREDTFVAGLSMGGYGAFKLALLKPEMFSAAASFSGAMDMERIANDRDMTMVFDSPVKGSVNDLFHLAENIGAVKPRLYQWCGTEDFLYADNVKFRDFMQKLDFDYTYKEGSGDHDWKCWDDQVRKVFAFMGIENLK